MQIVKSGSHGRIGALLIGKPHEGRKLGTGFEGMHSDRPPLQARVHIAMPEQSKPRAPFHFAPRVTNRRSARSIFSIVATFGLFLAFSMRFNVSTRMPAR